jgi:hypothetical protein
MFSGAYLPFFFVPGPSSLTSISDVAPERAKWAYFTLATPVNNSSKINKSQETLCQK